MSEKYANLLKDWADFRQKEALIMAKEAHALTAARIQNFGLSYKGEKFRGYSRKPLRSLLHLDETEFNAPSKIRKFKDQVRKGQIEPTYFNLRQAYGLPVDRRTLTFDGDMWLSITQEVLEHDEFKTVVVIRSKDRENQEKVNKNSGMLKSNILSLGEEEKRLIRTKNKERVKKFFNERQSNSFK